MINEKACPLSRMASPPAKLVIYGESAKDSPQVKHHFRQFHYISTVNHLIKYHEKYQLLLACSCFGIMPVGL
jgi:hypothetical protein